ncbi:MAG: hypothetical protein WAV47_13750, partial [Blastocatellia bacterium]
RVHRIVNGVKKPVRAAVSPPGEHIDKRSFQVIERTNSQPQQAVTKRMRVRSRIPTREAVGPEFQPTNTADAGRTCRLEHQDPPLRAWV